MLRYTSIVLILFRQQAVSGKREKRTRVPNNQALVAAVQQQTGLARTVCSLHFGCRLDLSGETPLPSNAFDVIRASIKDRISTIRNNGTGKHAVRKIVGSCVR